MLQRRGCAASPTTAAAAAAVVVVGCSFDAVSRRCRAPLAPPVQVGDDVKQLQVT